MKPMRRGTVSDKYSGPGVGWCFEPSQPLRIISGLKTNFNPSFNYSTHKSLKVNHNFSTQGSEQLSWYNTRLVLGQLQV